MTAESNTTWSAPNQFVGKLQKFVESLEKDEQEVFGLMLNRGGEEEVSGYLQNDTIYIDGHKWILTCVPTGTGQQFCFYYPS